MRSQTPRFSPGPHGTNQGGDAVSALALWINPPGCSSGRAGVRPGRLRPPGAVSRGIAPGEESVQLGDHRRALPDRCPYPLHRTGTDVAHGENSLDPSLQRQQVTVDRTHVGAGPDEALVV